MHAIDIHKRCSSLKVDFKTFIIKTTTVEGFYTNQGNLIKALFVRSFKISKTVYMHYFKDLDNGKVFPVRIHLGSGWSSHDVKLTADML